MNMHDTGLRRDAAGTARPGRQGTRAAGVSTPRGRAQALYPWARCQYFATRHATAFLKSANTLSPSIHGIVLTHSSTVVS